MVKITDVQGILLFLSVLYSSEYVSQCPFVLLCKACSFENGENANYFGIISSTYRICYQFLEKKRKRYMHLINNFFGFGRWTYIITCFPWYIISFQFLNVKIKTKKFNCRLFDFYFYFLPITNKNK